MTEIASQAASTSDLDYARFVTPKSHLRSLLVSCDMLALIVTWAAPIFLLGSTPLFLAKGTALSSKGLLYVFVGVLWSLFVLAGERLYRTRTCEMRTTEIMRIAHAVPLIAVFALVASRMVGEAHLARVPLFTGALFFLLVNVGRMSFRYWLIRARRDGRFSRNILLVGTSQQALSLAEHLDEKPELGFTICGVVGSPIEAEHRAFTAPCLGPISELESIVRKTGVHGALIAAQGIGEHQLNEALRVLLRNRVHVRMSTGIRGIDHRRLSSHSLGYEPMMYVDHVDLEGWQVVVKRVMDIAIAGTLLLLTSPLLAVAAFAVWLTDRGPVLFRQHRVGRDGKHFEILKLRSMVKDAEARLHLLQHENVRSGPLFKLHRDPRVTWIGRILRSTSIDELPQLWNVLRGDMSLVGPRPALPKEVEQFSETLLMRHNVLPGITGLWQVESRDDPDFTSYERLDVFYVENWSVLLDLSILVATFRVVVVRTLRAVPWRIRQRKRQPNGEATTVGVMG